MKAIVAFSLGLTTVSAAVGPMDRPAAPDRAELTRRAVESLQLRDAQIVEISIDRSDDATLRVAVRVDGVERLLALEPASVVAPEYKLIVQRGENAYEEFAGAHVPLYRGQIVAMPGSDVALARVAGGVEGLIRFPDGTRRWIEPLSGPVAGAIAGEHVLYRDADILASPNGCGTRDEVEANEAHPPGPTDGSTATGTVYVAELAIDTDVEYFQLFGSVVAVEAQIHKTINTMNLQYERDLSVRHIITRIIVRTAQPDPYSGSSVGTLINQVIGHWNAAQQSVPRDAVQMFTGQTMADGFLGIAVTNSLCVKSNAYSVVWSNTPGCAMFACKTDLSAHELGHIWSANHCECPEWTMNPVIQSANRFHPVEDIPGMIAFRNAKTCLGFMDKCIGAGTPDCNANGVADTCDVAAQTSPDVDGNGTPDECQPPPMPQLEDPPQYSNRYLAVISPSAPTLGSGTLTAFRVGMYELYNPVPAPGGVQPDFSVYEESSGCDDVLACGRWLGPPVDAPLDADSPNGATIRVSRLQCTPFYHDWTVEGLVHVVGAEILPSSIYSLTSYLGMCSGNEAACDAVSPDNASQTTRYGDVAAPFFPSFSFQPDALDVVGAVDAFRGVSGAPPKRLAQLQPNLVDVNADVDALDITNVVNAFEGQGYPYSGPCLCPSAVTCDATPCTSHSACSGGLCVRTCSGGSALGQPCRLDANCPGGACGSGFCRDRCSRCSP
jgi:hypothetical protein